MAHVKKPGKVMSFDRFRRTYDSSKMIYLGSTVEIRKDIFEVRRDYSLAHCVSVDLEMGKGIATSFKKLFGGLDTLEAQRPRIGKVLKLQDRDRFIFYLVTKMRYYHKPTYSDMWHTLKKLRKTMLKLKLTRLAVPRLGCGLDNLHWNVIHNMLEVIFDRTGINIVVCNYLKKSRAPCIHYVRGHCKRGSNCQFRH